MVECVSRKIQSKKMAKAFPFPQPTREKEKKCQQKRKKLRSFPLSRTNFSVPFRPPLKQQRGAKWICNLFKQLSLPFWESTFYLPLPQMSQSNVQMLPIQTNAGQICYNATK